MWASRDGTCRRRSLEGFNIDIKTAALSMYLANRVQPARCCYFLPHHWHSAATKALHVSRVTASDAMPELTPFHTLQHRASATAVLCIECGSCKSLANLLRRRTRRAEP